MKDECFVQLFSSFQLHPSSFLVEGLIEVPEDIVDVFDANAQTDEIRADTRGSLLLIRKLAVRGAGRMNGQRLGIAQVSDVTDEFQAIDEFRPGLATAFNAEAQHRAGALWQRTQRVGLSRRNIL